jgi:hypothetical protein
VVKRFEIEVFLSLELFRGKGFEVGIRHWERVLSVEFFMGKEF